jgi:hypothetical protein
MTKISFKVQGSWKEITEKFLTHELSTELVGDLKDGHLGIQDESFDSYAKVEFYQDRSIAVTTAWSGFKYWFYKDEYSDTTVVEYDGAYRALFEQCLMPQFEAIWEGATVRSSLDHHDLTIEEYVALQDRLYDFRHQYGTIETHRRPRCFQGLDVPVLEPKEIPINTGPKRRKKNTDYNL